MANRGTEHVVNMFIGSGTPGSGAERGKRTRILEIPLEKIKPNPNQPRKNFNPNQITELAQSIVQNGVLQPIGVRAIQDGYEIVFGERRWRAAGEAELKTVPCVILTAEATDFKTVALVENLHRQDLSAIEKAMAVKEIMVKEGLSIDSVGKKLGLGKTRVHQLLNILNLPEDMLDKFCTADLNEIHARALLMLKKHPEVQKDLFQEILIYKMTGQQAIAWAEKYLMNLPGKSPVTDVVDRSIKKLTKLEKKWPKMEPIEREKCIEELQSLRDKIEALLIKD